MPKPKKEESEKDFVDRCIPIVITDGTAKDRNQATAICYSMYRSHQKKLALRFVRRVVKKRPQKESK